MRVLCFLLTLFFFLSLNAQITHPKASPFATIVQEIGLSKIQVAYSRPAVRNRAIFGPQEDGQQGLVPYGRIWRVGANESTKITVDTNMEVMGNPLPIGTYALYAFPEKDAWEIVFHTNTTHWGDGRKNYDPAEDLFRVTVIPSVVPYHQENFEIAFDSITHNSARLNLIWASTKLTLPITVDTAAQMEVEIAQQLNEDPTAQTYYEAARYLQEQQKDPERALGYVNKALALGGDTYYFHRVKSLIQADLGNYQAAIISARKSLEIAAAMEKDEFVRMNQKNIKAWEEKQ
ncbi:MAG: DUF2911 domain-containing protein [Bacteroidota bacterium]